MVSMRMWVSDGLIVSARIHKIWAADAIRQKMLAGTAPATISAFVAGLANDLAKRIKKVSLALVEATDIFEENSFSPAKTLAVDLAELRQSAIKLRCFVRPQSEAVTSLASGIDLPLDHTSAIYLGETANRTVRTLEELDSTSVRLKAIQDHLDILHNSALVQNSYVLSIVATIFLPFGFITGLFGINVGGCPAWTPNLDFGP